MACDKSSKTDWGFFFDLCPEEAVTCPLLASRESHALNLSEQRVQHLVKEGVSQDSLRLLHTLLFGSLAYCSTEKRSTAVCGARIPKLMLRILGSDLQAYLNDHKVA
jgi:hypothetical protein